MKPGVATFHCGIVMHCHIVAFVKQMSYVLTTISMECILNHNYNEAFRLYQRLLQSDIIFVSGVIGFADAGGLFRELNERVDWWT